jgi:hypothetical protein
MGAGLLTPVLPHRLDDLLSRRWFPAMDQVCQSVGFFQNNRSRTDRVIKYFINGPLNRPLPSWSGIPPRGTGYSYPEPVGALAHEPRRPVTGAALRHRESRRGFAPPGQGKR